jgi:hypothetical protein
MKEFKKASRIEDEPVNSSEKVEINQNKEMQT